jgi:hypothetical protein
LSVVMPVYEGAPFLAAAVQSVLAQSYRDFELIVVDDGSTDDTASILQRIDDPRLRVLRSESNLGLPRSINRGIAAARGELIARHDADDLSRPDRFAAQVAFLDARRDVVLAGTAVRLIDARGRAMTRTQYKATSALGIDWQLLFDNPFAHGSVMFRRGAGEYDESFAWGEDYELWSRIAATNAVANLPEPLVDQRVHRASFTGRRDERMAALRREGVDRYAAVCRRNVLRIIGDSGLADEWAKVRVAIDHGWATGESVDAGRALQLIDAIAMRFDERHPAARQSEDIRRHRAWSMATIGCKLAPRSRGAAVRAFARAAATLPRMALPFGIPFAANLLFGSRLREIIRASSPP